MCSKVIMGGGVSAGHSPGCWPWPPFPSRPCRDSAVGLEPLCCCLFIDLFTYIRLSPVDSHCPLSSSAFCRGAWNPLLRPPLSSSLCCCPHCPSPRGVCVFHKSLLSVVPVCSVLAKPKVIFSFNVTSL